MTVTNATQAGTRDVYHISHSGRPWMLTVMGYAYSGRFIEVGRWARIVSAHLIRHGYHDGSASKNRLEFDELSALNLTEELAQ